MRSPQSDFRSALRSALRSLASRATAQTSVDRPPSRERRPQRKMRSAPSFMILWVGFAAQGIYMYSRWIQMVIYIYIYMCVCVYIYV